MAPSALLACLLLAGLAAAEVGTHSPPDVLPKTGERRGAGWVCAAPRGAAATTGPIAAPPPPPPRPLTPCAPAATEAELLLTFKAGITNWDAVQADRGWGGWDCAGAGCTPVCSWGGVTCNSYHVHEGNFVNELRLGCNGCGVKMRGRLGPGLHRLQHLELLYLNNNELTGPLPPEWGEPGGFLELLELNVNENQLTGAPGGRRGLAGRWRARQGARQHGARSAAGGGWGEAGACRDVRVAAACHARRACSLTRPPAAAAPPQATCPKTGRSGRPSSTWWTCRCAAGCCCTAQHSTAAGGVAAQQAGAAGGSRGQQARQRQRQQAAGRWGGPHAGGKLPAGAARVLAPPPPPPPVTCHCCCRPLRRGAPQMASNRFTGPFSAAFAVTNTSFISLMSL